MARRVATKAALSIRVDALTDSDGKSEPMAPSIGIENRAKLEARLRALEEGGDAAGVRSARNGTKQARFQMTGDTSNYNTAADAVDLVSTQREPMETALKAVRDVKAEKKKAKEEKKAKKKVEEAKKSEDEDSEDENKMDVDGEESPKEKKRKRRESAVDGEEKKSKVWCLCSTGLAVILIYFSHSTKAKPRQSERRGRKRRKLKRLPRKLLVIRQRKSAGSRKHDCSLFFSVFSTISVVLVYHNTLPAVQLLYIILFGHRLLRCKMAKVPAAFSIRAPINSMIIGRLPSLYAR